MSNIAGKAYAMNVVTPINWYMAWINRLIFWSVSLPFLKGGLGGLITLSLIHYARWAVIDSSKFPHLDETQEKENLKYAYMFFFSNFNGSWDQYVDSFHQAIPDGLDFFWFKNIKYPKSVPLNPFHEYINFNQIWTNHYYNAYPMAASNDVKSAQKVQKTLLEFINTNDLQSNTPEEFQNKFNQLIFDLQYDLSSMKKLSPIIGFSAKSVTKRKEQETN
jgi:hypothetical protein